MLVEPGKMAPNQNSNHNENRHEDVHVEPEGQIHEHSEGGWLPLSLSGTAIATGLILQYLQGQTILSSMLLILAAVLSGYKIAETGIRRLIKKNITISLLITIASIGAFAIGHFEEGAVVAFLFNIAEKLEDFAADRARHSIEALMELKPEVATIRKDGEEKVLPIEEVWPGEIFILRPGDRVPLDGIVVEGSSAVNQATITGESIPISKIVGEEVYAGTINLDGFLAVKVTKISEETVLARILKLVEEAEDGKSSTEAFVDRFAKFYTPLVITLAVLIAVIPPLIFQHSFQQWVYRALVMLVVACPCALAISTPVAMVSAIASAGRNGVLVKGSTFIEQMSRVKVVAFDKTGTLTIGELGVTDIVSPLLSQRDILKLAVALEEKAEHPIAKAIMERAKAEGVDTLKATDFRAYVGRGVEACINDKTCCIGNLRLFEELEIEPLDGVVQKLEAEGKTVVLVSEDGCAVGAIALMDKVRNKAVETIKDLKTQRINVQMLTGDNEVTAYSIAEKLDVDGYLAHLLPEEKVTAIKKLQADYGPVAMVGDGVNDAPALLAADVGVAMGAIGSDIALETADIALMEDDLTRFTYLVKLSKATMRRIRENITTSILVKLLVAALTLPGLVTLWIAVAIGDMGLSLAVILNSMRLSGLKADKA